MPHLRLCVALALSTAGGPSALFDLTWSRVDFARGTIRLARETGKKSKKGRATVLITEGARAELAEAKRAAETKFVPEWRGEPISTVKGSFEKACARACFDGVTPHVLRHTAGVWVAEAGPLMTEIAQYLGHTDPRVTFRVYARYSPEYLRGASGALELVPAGTNVPTLSVRRTS